MEGNMALWLTLGDPKGAWIRKENDERRPMLKSDGP